MEITVNVTAPELVSAINNLATAIAGKQTAPAAEPQQATPAPAQTVAPQQTAPAPAAPAAPTPAPQQAAPAPAQTVAPQQAAPAPAAPAPAPAPAPQQAAPTTGKAVGMDDLARAGAALVDQGKMPQVIALLNKYGVQAITQLAPQNYEAFAAELRSLGAPV